MDNVFLLAALIYAAGFWALCWRYPPVALALVFGSAPFQNDLSAGFGGVKFSFAEINLVLALPLAFALLFQGKKHLKTWPFLWPCALYFVICVASGFVQWRGGPALTSLFQMVLLMFVVPAVFTLLARRSEDMLLALWALLGVATFIALAIIITRSQYVFGIHKNGLGGSLGCAFLVAFELGFHLRVQKFKFLWLLNTLMIIIASGLFFTLSRGAWLGTIGGIVLIAASRRQFALIGRMLLLLIPVVAIGWQLLPQESRDYATGFDADRGNIEARYENQDLAMQLWEKNVVLGSGIGVRKQYDATQLVLFTLAETGILGFLTLTVVFWAFFRMVWKAQKNWPRDELSYSLLIIGGALMLARLGQGMVDHYWARGPTMMGWAAAGMATSAVLSGSKNASLQRLRRARLLLMIHVVETMRRRRNGDQSAHLSPEALQSATEFLAQSNAKKARGGRGI